MATTPNDKQRFSEDEVAFIMKRAAELQNAEQIKDVQERSGGSLTLQEVEEIAEEADIDPLSVRNALQELATRSSQNLSTRVEDDTLATLAGSPTTVMLERTVGGQISGDTYAELVGELRRTFDDDGLSMSLGRTLEWTTNPPRASQGTLARQVKVQFVSHEEVTTIRLRETMQPIAVALFLGLILSGIGATIGMTSVDWLLPQVRSVAIGLSLSAAAAGASYALARVIYSRLFSKRTSQLNGLMGRLERIVLQHAILPGVNQN